MSTAARAHGAAGAVVAGYIRDTNGILGMNFPVFSYGSYAQDQRGRGQVVDFNVPLEINGVTILPGDIIFGDIDGVVVLPKAVEGIVVKQALVQVRKENKARDLLNSGISAEAVFLETGVL
jgi:regulator of RNase E activity RraA